MIQPITGIIIGVLLASLISVGWAYYKRSSNKFRNGKLGKEVTLGFIIVAAATAFFIPTLSLLTVESENTTSINNFVNWHNGTLDVTIEYTNPLNVPLRHTMENLSNQLYVTITGIDNITIKSVQLLSPKNAINSHDGKFVPLENNTNSIKYMANFNARHSDEISNSSYPYNLRIEYSDKGTNTLKNIVIPFEWTVISKDMSWLGYFWIVLAGIVTSRFITFIIETGNLEKLDLNRTEALWLIYSFIIAVLAFAGFKEQDILGESIFFNIMAAFAFGFGSQKVLELAREFPRSPTGENNPPSQVRGLQVVLNAGPPRQMDLTWTANTETDLHHYNIYRGDQANFTVNLSTPDFTSQTNTYSDSPVDADQTYYYRIAAVNTSNTIGQLSVEVSAKDS